jgi:hypothetical protein
MSAIIGEENGLTKEHNSRMLGELDEVLIHDVAGDIIDFGCWKGTMSFLMAQRLQTFGITDKKIYLVDTFTGHPTEQITTLDKKWSFINNLEYFRNPSIDSIIDTFKTLGFDNYEIIQGDINNADTIDRLPASVCFASLDFNMFVPTIYTLGYLSQVMSNKSIVIEDDYENIDGITLAFNHLCHVGLFKVKKGYNPGGSFQLKSQHDKVS